MATKEQFDQLPVGLRNQIISAQKTGDVAKAKQLLDQGVAELQKQQTQPKQATTRTTTSAPSPTAAQITTTPAPTITTAPKTVTTATTTPKPTATPTLENVNEEYQKLISSGMTKENALAQLKTKLQSTQSTGGVSAYDKLKAQYKAPETLKLSKIEQPVEVYKATNGAKYELKTNPDGTVQFISAQTGKPRVFENREQAVNAIETVAKELPAKDIVKPTEISLTEQEKTEIAGPAPKSTKAQKDVIVSDITKGITLTNSERQKLEALKNLSDVEIRNEENNLRNYVSQLRDSSAEIINLNNRRSLQLENEMQEAIAANKRRIDQSTSLVMSQLGGRAKALSMVIGKDGRPLDDASMIALMGDTGVQAMQQILDTKNKILEENNKLKSEASKQIFELEKSNVITKDEANKAIYALEYQSRLRVAQITKDFYNNVFGVADAATQRTKTEGSAIQDKIYTILTGAGFSAEDIGNAMKELSGITDPNSVYQALYAKAADPRSAVAKGFANAKKTAAEALQSKYEQELKLKATSASSTSSNLPKPSMDNIASMKTGLDTALLSSGMKGSMDLNAINNNYGNIYSALTSAVGNGTDAIVPGNLLGLSQNLLIPNQDAGKIINAIREGKFEPVSLSSGTRLVDVNAPTPTANKPNTSSPTANKPNTKTQANSSVAKQLESSIMLPGGTITKTSGNADLRDTKVLNDYQYQQQKQFESQPNRKGFVAYSDGSGLVFNGDGTYIFINNKGEVSRPTKIGQSPNIKNDSGYKPDLAQINKNNEAIRNLIGDGNYYGTLVYPEGGSISFTGGGLYVYRKPDGTTSLATPIGQAPIYKK